MRWSDFNLTPIAEVTSAREMIEEVDNAANNNTFEELAGNDLGDFAQQWDREADEARERSLQESEGD